MSFESNFWQYSGLYQDDSGVEPTATDSVPYPKRIFLIFGNEFFEQFNFYGMRGNLLYLK